MEVLREFSGKKIPPLSDDLRAVIYQSKFNLNYLAF